MVTEKTIIKKILGHNNKIRGYGVKRIGIFGSFSRQTQTKRSDVDILVEFKKGEKTFDNYMDLKMYLKKIFKRKVDLVIEEALKPRIKKKIFKEVKYAGL